MTLAVDGHALGARFRGTEEQLMSFRFALEVVGIWPRLKWSFVGKVAQEPPNTWRMVPVSLPEYIADAERVKVLAANIGLDVEEYTFGSMLAKIGP